MNPTDINSNVTTATNSTFESNVFDQYKSSIESLNTEPVNKSEISPKTAEDSKNEETITCVEEEFFDCDVRTCENCCFDFPTEDMYDSEFCSSSCHDESSYNDYQGEHD